MALEMKETCERCQAYTPPDGVAHICSYECTFCPTCSDSMKGLCANCGGELVPRPKRIKKEKPE